MAWLSLIEHEAFPLAEPMMMIDNYAKDHLLFKEICMRKVLLMSFGLIVLAVIIYHWFSELPAAYNNVKEEHLKPYGESFGVVDPSWPFVESREDSWIFSQYYISAGPQQRRPYQRKSFRIPKGQIKDGHFIYDKPIFFPEEGEFRGSYVRITLQDGSDILAGVFYDISESLLPTRSLHYGIHPFYLQSLLDSDGIFSER